jgi:uncharacterized protein
MGAVSDIVNMGDWTRMRMWGMAVGVAMIGFYGMGWRAGSTPAQTIYASGRIIWLSALVGGALFGFGMVLASGCGSKTLVRIGAAASSPWWCFFVMGLAAFATLRGVFAVLREYTVDQVAFDIAAGAPCRCGWRRARAWRPALAGFWSAHWWWVGAHGPLGLGVRTFAPATTCWPGLGLGLVIALMWWISGHLGFVPEHPETLEPVYRGHQQRAHGVADLHRAHGLHAGLADLFQRHLQGADLRCGDRGRRGAGSFLCRPSPSPAAFRWEGFRDTQDTALHLVGAVLMGVGGVTAWAAPWGRACRACPP